MLMLSLVRSTVALVFICTTFPRKPPAPVPSPREMKSPGLIDLSKSNMIPETRLLAIVCIPKPIPTESAPATRARELVFTPIIDKMTMATTNMNGYFPVA